MTAVAIPLIKSEKFAFVSPEDAGLVSAHIWRAVNYNGRHWYAMAYIGGGKNIVMHRLVLGVAVPGYRNTWVDHIDNDGLNNTRENIRLVTPGQNVSRARNRKRKYEGLRGVSKHGNSWVARISRDREKIYLGSFPTEREAGIAYDAACKVLFGKFAPEPNFP